MNPIRHIRKNIFKVRQTEFAVIAGVTQATVSRWESGGAPSLEEMQRIRAAAAERRLRWSDKYFFDAPAPQEGAAA